MAADRKALSIAERLKLFDEATARQQVRNRAWRRQRGPAAGVESRGWSRAEVYTRGNPFLQEPV